MDIVIKSMNRRPWLGFICICSLSLQIVGDAFVKCINRSSKSVYEGILDAVSETESDILVMGISG